jgi:hypothetical protein
MAGALLILGMVGVVQLIITSMNQFGNSNARVNGQMIAAGGVAEVLTMPYAAFSTVGVFDGGVVTDENGRRFTRTITVTAAGDGGIAAREVLVETRWRENAGSGFVDRLSRVSFFISELPDAGF